MPELHRRAARWYAAHGQPLEALRHAADAEDWPLVGELFVTQAAPLLVSAERSVLGQVLARIPSDHQRANADLAMCAAARLYLEGRFADMRPCLGLAGDLLAAGPSGPHHGASRLALLVLSTVVSRWDGDIPALLVATSEALDLLAELTGEVPAAEAYRAVALANHGTGLLWSGDVSGARACLLDALAAADGAELDVTRVNVLSHLALTSAALGRPGEGFEYANRAIGVVGARGWSPLPQVATAYLARAMIHLQRHELDDAETALERGLVAGYSEPATRWTLVLAGARLALSAGRIDDSRDRLALARTEQGAGHTPPFLARWLAITEAEVGLASGRAAEASDRLTATLRDRQPPYVQEQCLLARAALALGDPRGADEVLRPLRQDRSGPPATDVPVWLLTGLAADRLREDSRAIDALGRAVAAAGPDRIFRPFTASDPEQLERMLLRLQELRPELTETVGTLLTLLGRGGPEHAAASLADPLTDRELSVLQFLPTMMTNGEIAADLFVSVNTVKAHLKRIFLKLDVTSKRQAVQRARELGLLPGGPP